MRAIANSRAWVYYIRIGRKITMDNAPAKVKRDINPVKKFFMEHENIRQIVVFTLCSLVCFAIEYISFTVIELCIKGLDQPVDWIVFEYDHARTFVAFLVSNVLAQTATFILNRKKTFKATNNVLISGIMFAIMMVGIILLNTYLGGVITSAAQRTFEPSMGAKTAEIVAGYCGKLTGSLLSFVISFLGNKFLVMRNWKVASYKAAIYEAEYEHAPAELLAADTEEE